MIVKAKKPTKAAKKPTKAKATKKPKAPKKTILTFPWLEDIETEKPSARNLWSIAINIESRTYELAGVKAVLELMMDANNYDCRDNEVLDLLCREIDKVHGSLTQNVEDLLALNRT